MTTPGPDKLAKRLRFAGTPPPQAQKCLGPRHILRTCPGASPQQPPIEPQRGFGFHNDENLKSRAPVEVLLAPWLICLRACLRAFSCRAPGPDKLDRRKRLSGTPPPYALALRGLVGPIVIGKTSCRKKNIYTSRFVRVILAQGPC